VTSLSVYLVLRLQIENGVTGVETTGDGPLSEVLETYYSWNRSKIAAFLRRQC
jgi:hypothetical protein